MNYVLLDESGRLVEEVEAAGTEPPAPLPLNWRPDSLLVVWKDQTFSWDTTSGKLVYYRSPWWHDYLHGS